MAADAERNRQDEFVSETLPVVLVAASLLVARSAQMYVEERLPPSERNRFDLLIVLVGFAVYFSTFAFWHLVALGSFGFALMCLGAEGLWRYHIKGKERS